MTTVTKDKQETKNEGAVKAGNGNYIFALTKMAGMAMQFIAKDVRIAVDTAKSIGAAVPLGEKTAELWAAACEKLGGTRDQTEIVRYWEEASGVKL